MITALKLLKSAAAKGWSFKVICEDEVDYKGSSATAAWKAVKATEESWVVFYGTNGKRLGAAFLMAPGPGSCSPEESVVNYTCDGYFGGEFEALCDSVTESV